MAGEATTEALVERLFTATVGALELSSVYLGVRLGLYDVLSHGKSMSAEDLAEAAGIHARYAREWLEQQAVAGLLSAEGDDPVRFTLPETHRPVLADPLSPSYVAPFSLMVASCADVLPQIVEAYRTGGGLPFSAYGADMREGQSAINRPAYLDDLPHAWLPAMPDVHARLRGSAGSRVADVGCGAGWGAIGIATTYSGVRVDGFDPDVESIEAARRNAADAGVDDRVTFHATGIGDAEHAGRYDLVCILEALHDMAQPVEVLSQVRGLLAEDGTVLVVDERVGEELITPGDETERMMYGWSVLHCLVAGMAEQPTAATGTVMRPPTLRAYATEAGFSDVEVLDVDNDLFRLYRLRV